MKRKKLNFSKLIKIMKKLIGPDGCPWDKKQTHRTLLKYLREEVEEFKEAVYKNDYENMKEELGDILLQIVFHSELASKKGYFDISDVIDNLSEKLIRRHPHVFAGLKVKDEKEVIKNWKKIKSLEKKKKEE
jgi:tetrapyrrole methylase family protein/MazG family protein